MITRRLIGTRDYLAAIGPTLRLVWRAGPGLCLVSAVLMLVTGLLPVANIVVISDLLDTLIRAAGRPDGAPAATPPSRFLVLLGLLAAMNILAQIAERCSQVLSKLHGTRIENSVQLLIGHKNAQVDLGTFEDHEFHNRMRTVADEAPFRPQQMLDEVMLMISSLTTLVSLATVLAAWHPWMVVVLLVSSVGALWVSTRFGSLQVDLTTHQSETQRRKYYLNSLLVSDQAAKEIRLFGLQTHLLDRLRSVLDLIYRQDRRFAIRELTHSLPAGLVVAGVEVALIVYTALRALAGEISVGEFNQYMLTIVALAGLLPGLAAGAGSLHESNLFARRLFDFLDTQPQVEAPRVDPARIEAPHPPRITFDGVSFRYPGTAREVLTDVSLTIEPGEVIALVGENGAGKSTVVKLLTGLYEPSRGRILFNGVDISTVNREELRALLSVTFQDFTVYHFSVLENVALGQVDRTDELAAIIGASEHSGLDGVVARLPEKYDTVLGRFWDKGHELSGGQRQLVALARALFRTAPVLVLDEPSSALDGQTERRFFDTVLADGSPGEPRTTIFVSHRLTTVRRADRIIVMKDGSVAEQGTHDALLSRAGEYAGLYHLHAAAFVTTPARSGVESGGDQ